MFNLMKNRDMRIAVVGGGLSGFSVALMLVKRGFRHVVVFERDESINHRRQGYGLTILQVSLTDPKRHKYSYPLDWRMEFVSYGVFVVYSFF